jgi:hypothetical protein
MDKDKSQKREQQTEMSNVMNLSDVLRRANSLQRTRGTLESLTHSSFCRMDRLIESEPMLSLELTALKSFLKLLLKSRHQPLDEDEPLEHLEPPREPNRQLQQNDQEEDGGGHSSEGRLVLVAVEYAFDDGACKHGRGDALLYDEISRKLIVLECKRRGHRGKAAAQAKEYARRLASWLRHIASVDGDASSFFRASCVEAWTVVEDDRGKLKCRRLHFNARV